MLKFKIKFGSFSMEITGIATLALVALIAVLLTH